MEELNELIGGDDDGYFSENHTPDSDNLWKEIVYLEKERRPYYEPARSKASSVRNPAFRYLHRLITSTIVGRGDPGSFGTIDMHLFWACIHEIKQDAALWLAEHFESQALLHGSQRIGCGAWITPMCHKFRVTLPKEPVSRDILLDREALQRQEMLSHEEGYVWKLHEMNAHMLLRLPCPHLTSVLAEGDKRRGNWNLSSGEHLRMITEPGRRLPRVEEREDEQEEQAYEQGDDGQQGYEDVPQPGFHMRAPEFSTMHEWHTETMEAMDNYHWDGREFVESQVQGVREEVQTLRTEVDNLRTYIGGRFDTLDTYFENERKYREEEAKSREDERVYMENYNRMVHEMHYFYPHYPPQHQLFDPNNPDNPPFPPPYQ